MSTRVQAVPSGVEASEGGNNAKTGEGPGCARCVLLEEQRNALRSEKGYWQGMHAKAVERERKARVEIEELKAKLKLREQQLFGRKTEKTARTKHTEQSAGAGQKPKRPRGRQRGSPGYGRHYHHKLPVREEWTDLEEKAKRCPQCGEALAALHNSEDSELVEVEVRAYRRRIRRKRYHPVCQCRVLPSTVIAPAVPRLIAQGAYGVSFWVQVLLDKFLLQRPTNRLLLSWKLEMGLEVSPGTVAGGLKALVPLFEPLMEPIIERNLLEGRWHADETRWMVFAEMEGKDSARWYLWVFASPSTVVFYIEPTRSREVPLEHFGQQAQGILNVDRYSAYKVLLRHGRITLAYCWAHVRRDFLGVARQWPAQQDWATEWVELIGQLYRLNDQRLLLKDQPPEWAQADAALRQGVHTVLEHLQEQLSSKALLPPARKVLQSLTEHWQGLTVFVEHPEVPMDNNPAERLQRGPVVGRKNYYGSRSLWSASFAAILFSLFQTLLRWGINPRLWLSAYLQSCATAGGVPPDVTRFLPWNMTDEQLARFRRYEPPSFDTS